MRRRWDLAGLSPRGGSAKTGRRGATLEGLDWLFGSGVAPRRAPFPHHYSVGSSPRLPSRSRSATSPKVIYTHRADRRRLSACKTSDSLPTLRHGVLQPVTGTD